MARLKFAMFLGTAERVSVPTLWDAALRSHCPRCSVNELQCAGLSPMCRGFLHRIHHLSGPPIFPQFPRFPPFVPMSPIFPGYRGERVSVGGGWCTCRQWDRLSMRWHYECLESHGNTHSTSQPCGMDPRWVRATVFDCLLSSTMTQSCVPRAPAAGFVHKN